MLYACPAQSFEFVSVDAETLGDGGDELFHELWRRIAAVTEELTTGMAISTAKTECCHLAR